MEGRQLTVSRLLGDHMVLQCGKPSHLWGTGAPGRQIRAVLSAEDGGSDAPDAVETTADEEGGWSLFLPAMEPSDRTWRLTLSAGEDEIRIRDVVFGDVFFASGQSNMDMMIERVRDRYPDVAAGARDPMIRSFKIAEHAVYGGPLTEPATGEWQSVSPETIRTFSATAYFFARTVRAALGRPVGFIHASLGGSKISCWMSREMLSWPSFAAPEGYPRILDEAERYASEEFRKEQVERNEKNAAAWNKELADREAAGETESSGEIDVPCFFHDITELRQFIGAISFTKHFTLTADMMEAAKKSAAGTGVTRIFLGTLVDRDETYLNGTKIGETGYQYPPRKYDVDPSLLKEGDNELVIRLVVEGGNGRFTPGKKYAIFCEKEYGKTKRDTSGFVLPGEEEDNILWEIDLTGPWEYRILSAMDRPVPPADFINWHPTGLYNGMTAPCHPYTIRGFLWYQGESDAGEPDVYEDLQRRMVLGYRKAWAGAYASPEDEDLPFYYVQLPNFLIDQPGGEDGWEPFRRAQERLLSVENCGMIETMGLGEDNDLHPHEKEEIGKRLAGLYLADICEEEGSLV